MLKRSPGGFETKAAPFGFETKEAQFGSNGAPQELGELQNEVKQFTVDLKKFSTDTLTSFEQFKQENDKRLALLEAKKSVDPLIEEKVSKIADSIVAQQERSDQIAATLTRLNQNTGTGQENTSHKYAHKFFQDAACLRNPSHVIRPDEVNLKEYEDYKSAWNRWARKDESMLTVDERKALQVGSDPDGGYLVNPEMSAALYQTQPDRIIQHPRYSKPFRTGFG